MSHLNIAGAPNAFSHYRGAQGNSTSSAPYPPFMAGLSGGLKGPEIVDGARLALYKTRNGGGRNPAAAVL
jgi:hypothetical protein